MSNVPPSGANSPGGGDVDQSTWNKGVIVATILAAFVIGGIVWLATNTRHTAMPAETPRFLGSTEVVPRDLFDQIDDSAAQLGLLYLHERLGEREPVSRGEEVENVGG